MGKAIHIELHTFEDLTLYKWDKFLITNDINWFRLDFDGRQPKINTDELIKRKEEIIEDYTKFNDDSSFSNKLKVWAKIDWLVKKHYHAGSLLKVMWDGFADDQMDLRYKVIASLKAWGFKFPEINTIDGDKALILEYRQALDGIKTQIEILKKEVSEEAKQESRNMYDDMLTVSRALQLGYRLNAKEVLLPEWITMCKKLKEISKLN